MLNQIKKYFGKKIGDCRSKKVISAFQKSNHLSPNKNIIITGSPRSGTTWLAEIFQKEPGSYMLFEPLSLRNEKFKVIGFDWRQHIPEQKKWPEAKNIFSELFEGKYITPWMISHSDPYKLKDCNFFILKFVRANLLLPWIINNFERERLPVYIYRNPHDVVKSQMQNFWNVTNSNFVLPKSRFAENYYNQFENIIQSVSTPTQQLTARWCLDNYYLLTHPDNNLKWITVNYDQLIKEPENELRKIYSRWNKSFDPEIIKAIQQKSKSTYTKNNSGSKDFNKTECSQLVKDFKLEDFIIKN